MSAPLRASDEQRENGVRDPRPAIADALWRIALVGAATTAAAAEAPVWVRLPLSLAALVAVAAFALRRWRGRNAVDTAAVAVGSGTVGLALLGLVLNLLPGGLGAASWALGVGTLETVLVAVLAFRMPTRPPVFRTVAERNLLPAVGWALVIGAVLAAAVVWSTASFQQTHVAPLAMSAEPSGDSVTISVTSGTASGPYDLVLLTDAGRSTLATDVRVSDQVDSATTFRLPADTRGTVELVPSGGGSPVRALTLDDTETGTAR